MRFICLLIVMLQISCRTSALSDLSEKKQGGSRDGNGGHGLVCKEPQDLLLNKMVGFYDVYEARRLKFKVALADTDFSQNQQVALKAAKTIEEKQYLKAQYVLDRIKVLDPYQHKIFSHYLKEFQDSHGFGGCPDYPDEDSSLLPQGCSLEVAVCNTEPNRRIPFRYKMIEELWGQFSEDDIVAARIHEAVYRRARFLKHTNSASSVTYVSYLLGGKLEAMALKDYVAFVEEEGFPAYYRLDFKGQAFYFERGETEFYPNGSLKRGFPITADDPFYEDSGDTNVGLDVVHGNTLDIALGFSGRRKGAGDAEVSFDEKGNLLQVKNATLYNREKTDLGYTQAAPNLAKGCRWPGDAPIGIAVASFSSAFVLTSFAPSDASVLPACAFRSRQGAIAVPANTPISLHPSGAIRDLVLRDDADIQYASGRKRILRGTRVAFAEDGVAVP